MPENNLSTSNTPPPKKTKVFFGRMLSWTLGIAGIVVVVLIIGLGARLAGHVWNPKWNPFHQTSNSDKIIREKIKQEIKR
ncbi:MAG: hypothetical protein ACHQVK_02940 [Candidatus Paceibacterales bacterium]